MDVLSVNIFNKELLPKIINVYENNLEKCSSLVVHKCISCR